MSASEFLLIASTRSCFFTFASTLRCRQYSRSASNLTRCAACAQPYSAAPKAARQVWRGSLAKKVFTCITCARVSSHTYAELSATPFRTGTLPPSSTCCASPLVCLREPAARATSRSRQWSRFANTSRLKLSVFLPAEDHQEQAKLPHSNNKNNKDENANVDAFYSARALTHALTHAPNS